ncbi:Cyclic nucleotide-binding domain-containing protein [Verrucomicrobium sp. GAS474]|uniref:cyclic nucleotide-binding domain-containing protein n=1 Tax=Verrucomicrobium sp. GAS474 TaxID=1882831 RepID=UPI00087B3099|nr:cyclic nucleotide-binding domain-containing protein [Verrucomicrobium sp. GAS474]SDT96660.1 Cyclic nucleotide-binding domain-containing protein [Verrucomicrobium sp. GAS474]
MKETPFLDKEEASTISTLRQVSFFSHLEDRHIREIFKMSRLRQFDPGEVVIPEGVYDTYVYVLLTGEVEVRKNNASITRLHKTGDIFGELAIINYEPRSASVFAMAKTSCLAIDAAFLDSLLPHDRDTIYAVVYKMFAEIVANRLRATSTELAATREEVIFLRAQLAQYQRQHEALK